MAEHVTILHMSDPHILPNAEERLHGADTAGNLRRAAAHIRAMQITPDAVIISGDLTRSGEAEGYVHLRQLIAEELEPFGAPVLLNLGNHDLRVPFRQVILGQAAAEDEDEPYFYSRMIGPVRVIMLDSKIPESHHGALGDTQLAWLERELSEPAPAGNLIVIHHPVVRRGQPRAEDYVLRDADLLRQVINGRAVLGVLGGHTHVSTVAHFGDTVTATAPGIAFLLDPSIAHGGRILDGAGFNLCTVREGRLLVNPVILPGEQRELLRYGAVPEVAARG
jgi:3',5'-cyclic AMP phosphodiesterase CpdA